MRIAERPIIYEINTAVFLHDLSRKYQKFITLATVPASEWDALAELPIDAVWLMGVWQRSPAGKKIALENPEYKKLLPDLVPDDVLGSAYCIGDYLVDAQFGGADGLAAARQELSSRGIGLLLDFVPNHVALDHAWASTNPEYFIQGSEKDLKHHPKAFYESPNGVVIAIGKDPNYDPWLDVAQLNAFSEAYRQAAIQTLKNISDQCDGVRCDMAMLMCKEIFERTWGKRAGSVPESEFWTTVIGAVRQKYPDFLFLAEVYWDMQETLLNQGFGLCYDKTFYDLADKPDAREIHHHLLITQPYQKKLLRFIENHDEERAAKVLEVEKEQAAAVMLTMLEGARLYLEGQFEGYSTRIPVQLRRGPMQESNKELQDFYKVLLRTFASLELREAEWGLLDCRSPHIDRPSKHLIAWEWRTGSKRYVVAVNYSDKHAKAKVYLGGTQVANFKRLYGDVPGKFSLKNNSLSIVLDAWRYVILELL